MKIITTENVFNSTIKDNRVFDAFDYTSLDENPPAFADNTRAAIKQIVEEVADNNRIDGYSFPGVYDIIVQIVTEEVDALGFETYEETITKLNRQLVYGIILATVAIFNVQYFAQVTE